MRIIKEAADLRRYLRPAFSLMTEAPFSLPAAGAGPGEKARAGRRQPLQKQVMPDL
jgi:hypothetical protein